MSEKKKKLAVNPYVFFPSAFIALVFVLIGACFTVQVSNFVNKLQDFITTHFGWLYILTVAGFLFFVIWLLFSRFGNIKLGNDDDEPEFSMLTWFAMLFSAGMGIGLLFYSVAEPVLIYNNPPGGAASPQTINAAKEAMKYTFFHWGLHAWGIYIVIGLALSYFSYRHKLPLQIRSTLYPVLGEKIFGFWGNLIETVAVLGTLFGVATSLGLGVMQVNSGLAHLNILSSSTLNQVILIIAITLMATISVVSGVGRGIRRLSELNLFLGLILLAFVFFAGPTTFLLRAFAANVGNYLQTFLITTFQTDIFHGTKFQKTWTLFYWGWWIAWSPFVGMFIARVSRGRTIRQFIAGVLLVPTILTFIWLTVFGDTALHMELVGKGGMVTAVNNNISTAIFVLLEKLPFQAITCFLAVLVVVFFFVTSSDSASLVVDILTSGGKKNPPVWQKIFWANAEGLVAIILLVAGGLTALQTAVITTALPFCVIMIAICYCLWKALKTETEIKKAGKSIAEKEVFLSKDSIAVPGVQPVETPISESIDLESEGVHTSVQEQVSETSTSEDFKNWEKRLERLKSRRQQDYLTSQPDTIPKEKLNEADKKLKEFIFNTVKPAFISIEKELIKYDRKIRMSISPHQASIIVFNNGIEELYYGIRGKAYHRFNYSFPSFNPKDVRLECFAQVVVRSGSRTPYQISKFNKRNIIHDFLNEYEKWALLS
ncbi:MAG: BCCT family transporter [Victivallales bacterium]|nr:BCCT family transporter [Victivallales bacterium]MCF7889326.1 BCCT family transporter [Victivallales bacterium]